MKRRTWFALLTLAAVCAGPIGCNSQDVTVQGSGATFPAPIYKRWFLEFYRKHPETRVNYTPIGSGAGIRQFTQGLTVFGASDAGMSEKEIEALPDSFITPDARADWVALGKEVEHVRKQAKDAAEKVKKAKDDKLDEAEVKKLEAEAKKLDAEAKKLQAKRMERPPVYLLPMTAGSIVLSYNVPGVTKPIRLSRDAYLGIFLGEIKTWNDLTIIKCNDEEVARQLPSLPVTVVRRADSSGTTDVFTHHLEAIGGATKEKEGKWPRTRVGKMPNAGEWQSLIAAQGNDGVAALIQLTPGAIGYLEFGYAELAHLPTAHLQNKAGAYVEANPASGLAALAETPPEKFPADLQIKNPDPHSKEAYPIVTYTWVLCRGYYPRKDAREAQAFQEVLRFCLEPEQQKKIAAELDYIPLPESVIQRVRQSIDRIEIEGVEKKKEGDK